MMFRVMIELSQRWPRLELVRKVLRHSAQGGISMRTLIALSALALLGGTASAQVVSAGVSVAVPPPPSITFEVAPPLVYVSPGVQVVEGYDEEVFFTSGWYWCRRDGVWFRTHDYHGGWAVAPRRYVPARIYHVPPGQYRNYHYAGGRPGYGGRGYGGRPGYAVARPGHGGAVARPVGYRGAPAHGGGHAYAAPAGRPMMVHGGGGGGGGGNHGGGHGRGR
jgi:hypothetical protein